MQIVPEMLKIQGRVFDPEKVIYANNKSFIVDAKSGEWAHMCRNSTLISAMPLKHWLLVYTSKCYKVVMTFSEKLYHVASSVGFRIQTIATRCAYSIEISTPQYVEIRDESKNSYLDAIRKNYDDKTQCIVCVFPGLNKDRYDAIKQLCSVNLSVPSQCVVQKYGG
jgi:aubergine-like protein